MSEDFFSSDVTLVKPPKQNWPVPVIVAVGIIVGVAVYLYYGMQTAGVTKPEDVAEVETETVDSATGLTTSQLERLNQFGADDANRNISEQQTDRLQTFTSEATENTITPEQQARLERFGAGSAPSN